MSDVTDIVKKLNLGTSKAVIEGRANSPMQELLIGLHQEILDRLNKSMEKYDIRASNRLKQSIHSIDKSKDGALDVQMKANFYAKYVNFGVNGAGTGDVEVSGRTVNRSSPTTWSKDPSGTESFHDAIKGWIRDKGIQARPGQTYDQLAFAIMRSVKEYGMEARPFYTDVVNKELKAYLTKSISEVFGKALTIEISDPWQ
jgi:hypothetical protein